VHLGQNSGQTPSQALYSLAMRTHSILPVGKLPAAALQALLRTCHPPASSRLVIGPRYGEDAAVIDFGEKYLVAKTTPSPFPKSESDGTQ